MHFEVMSLLLLYHIMSVSVSTPVIYNVSHIYWEIYVNWSEGSSKLFRSYGVSQELKYMNDFPYIDSYL